MTSDQGRHILVVEDDRWSQRFMADLLRSRSYEVSTAATGEDALAALRTGDIELMMLDIGLPDMDGVDLATEVRRSLKLLDLPIVAITGLDGDAHASRFRAAGIHAWLTKPVDIGQLTAVAESLLGPPKGETMPASADPRAGAHASPGGRPTLGARGFGLDPAGSGRQLGDRATFLARVEQAIRRATVQNRALAVVNINVIGFREINEAFGYELGDELLLDIARKLNVGDRSDEFVAHLGGDNFAVLLTDPDRVADIDGTLDLLQQGLAGRFRFKEHEVLVAFRVGAAVFPGHGATADRLLAGAERATELARAAATRQALSAAAPERSSQAALALASDFERALRSQELVLHYQPQIEAASGRVHGVEALVRWQHPERGLLSPSAFVPLIETTPLMRPFTAWVVNEAARELRALSNHGRNDISVAVNISANDLGDDGLASGILQSLDLWGVDPANFRVEVTETVAVRDRSAATRVLGPLRDAGVGVSLDDMGVGATSFALLKSLPIDELKIDRAFVPGPTADRSAEAYIRAFVDIGHSEGLTVLAEGVETYQELTRLTALGCDLLQGYYIARPMPHEQLVEWLRHREPQAQGIVDAEMNEGATLHGFAPHLRVVPDTPDSE